MIRVTLITGEYPPDLGGVADYTERLAAALSAEGLLVEVLAPRRAAPQASTEPPGGRDRGAEVRTSQPTGTRPSDVRVATFRVAKVWGWSLGRALGRLVAHTRPDILHIQYQAAAYQLHPGVNIAPWWLRYTHVPVKIAFTYHDLRPPYLFPKAGRLRRWITMLPARWSHLTVVTNELDYLAVATEGRPWSVALVPIGSNIPDRPPPGYDPADWRLANGVGPSQSLVAFFGMLNEQKGIESLIEAVATLIGEGRDLRLAMVGELTGTSDPTNADYRQRIETRIAASGVPDRVLWTGHLPAEEVSAWLHAADVVALPYRDGWSYRRGSLLAALTHGCPIVTTERPPLPAGVVAQLPPLVDGESALLVPVDDAPALAAALRRLLTNRDLATRMGEAARRLARHFAWSEIARRHRELYEALLAASTS